MRHYTLATVLICLLSSQSTSWGPSVQAATVISLRLIENPVIKEHNQPKAKFKAVASEPTPFRLHLYLKIAGTAHKINSIYQDGYVYNNGAQQKDVWFGEGDLSSDQRKLWGRPDYHAECEETVEIFIDPDRHQDSEYFTYDHERLVIPLLNLNENDEPDLFGDMDFDGDVDFDDVAYFVMGLEDPQRYRDIARNVWRITGHDIHQRDRGDTDFDDDFDFDDIQGFVNVLGGHDLCESSSIVVTPEPSTVGLFALGLGLLITMRFNNAMRMPMCQS